MTTRPRSRTGSMDRVVDLLVALYPAEFRRGYGRAIAQLIRDQRRDLGRVSRPRAAAFWARVVVDLARTATVERASAVGGRAAALVERGSWAGRLRLALGALLLAAAGANVAVDLLSPKLGMGVGAALLTLAATCSGSALVVRARRAARRR